MSKPDKDAGKSQGSGTTEKTERTAEKATRPDGQTETVTETTETATEIPVGGAPDPVEPSVDADGNSGPAQ